MQEPKPACLRQAERQVKFSEHKMRQTKRQLTFPKRVRLNNQWHPKPNSQESDLERHEYHEIYPLFLARHCRNLKELTLVRILTPHLLLSGSHLQTPEWVGFKVEHRALISARIWQDFPLFLLSPWLFKGITGRSLLENPLRSHQCWKGLLMGTLLGV